MTVPGARRRETALAYSGGTIDRAGNQRTDPAWVDATLAAAGARVIPLWRDRCIVSGDPAVPAILAASGARAVLEAAAETVFLGLDEGAGFFAADLSPLEESQAVGLAGGERALRRPGRDGDLPGLAGLAVPVRADGRLPGYRAHRGGDPRRRGSPRGPLVHPRPAHGAGRGPRPPRPRGFDRPLPHAVLAGGN